MHGQQSLFRPEIIEERQTRWLGTVLLAPKISHRLFATFAVLSTAGILALLFYSDYTRKERINGWLVPEKGLVRILAPSCSRPGWGIAIVVSECRRPGARAAAA